MHVQRRLLLLRLPSSVTTPLADLLRHSSWRRGRSFSAKSSRLHKVRCERGIFEITVKCSCFFCANEEMRPKCAFGGRRASGREVDLGSDLRPRRQRLANNGLQELRSQFAAGPSLSNGFALPSLDLPRLDSLRLGASFTSHRRSPPTTCALFAVHSIAPVLISDNLA